MGIFRVNPLLMEMGGCQRVTSWTAPKTLSRSILWQREVMGQAAVQKVGILLLEVEREE
jgi:hypothetical protein